MSHFQKSMNDDEFVALLNEHCGCGPSEGDGITMLLQNLAKIQEYAGEVLMNLNNENPEDLEDWIENKISQCAQSIGDVKHYLDFRGSAYAIQQHGMEQAPPGIEGGSPMPLGRPEMSPPSSMAGSGGYEGGISNVPEEEPEVIGIGIGIEAEPEMEEPEMGAPEMEEPGGGMEYGEEEEEEDNGYVVGEGEKEEKGEEKESEEKEEEEKEEEGEEKEDLDESIYPQMEGFSLKSALLNISEHMETEEERSASDAAYTEVPSHKFPHDNFAKKS